MSNASVEFEKIIEDAMASIKRQVISRGYRVSNEMRNSVMLTIRGQGHGRRYKLPGTYRRQRDKKDGKMKNGRYYTASAPGEVPAIRTGTYRMSWTPNTHITDTGSAGVTVKSVVDSRLKVNGYVLGELLEEGTEKMAPRPHQEKIMEESEKAAMRIYEEPYF